MGDSPFRRRVFECVMVGRHGTWLLLIAHCPGAPLALALAWAHLFAIHDLLLSHFRRRVFEHVVR